jgi:hypothetical protein
VPCPTSRSAPAAVPRRSASPASDGLTRLVRWVVLIAAATGAGFLVAALFGGPAAASPADRSSSDGGGLQQVRAAVGTTVRLALEERPSTDRNHPGSGPVRTVVTTITRVTDTVLSPDLRAVIGSALPPASDPSGPTVPPARSPAPWPGPDSGPSSGPSEHPVPTAPESPRDSTSAPTVPSAVPAMATSPPSASVVSPVHPAASTGHGAVRPDAQAVSSGHPGRPVPPADEDAVGVHNGSAPGPGLLRAPGWQSWCGAGRCHDPVPDLVEGLSPSVVARPG